MTDAETFKKKRASWGRRSYVSYYEATSSCASRSASSNVSQAAENRLQARHTDTPQKVVLQLQHSRAHGRVLLSQPCTVANQRVDGTLSCRARTADQRQDPQMHVRNGRL